MAGTEHGVENWEKDRDKLARFRARGPRHLGGILVEPGAGHFAWSDRNAEYLALFISRAAAARIPADWPIDADQPIACKAIDPASGWLTDLAIKSQRQHAPAPYDQYSGDKRRAAWHFDRMLAEATVAYHAGIRSEDQFISWDDPHTVSAGARNFFSQIDWTGDGRTFKVHPRYADRYPRQFGDRGARWGKAGQPVGHADVPIRVKQVSGPIEAVGDHAFRILYNELAPATETARITFMAYSTGDERFRYTERVGMISGKLTKISSGKPQTITFPLLNDLTADSPPAALHATSDSGLPVDYHIAYGPARIVDGKLVIADLPRRARYPIALSIVAYQFGRGVAPHIQTATPVERTLHVLAP